MLTPDLNASISVFPVAKYTREAGVRTLERRIAAICRAVAVKVAEHSIKQKAAITAKEEENTREEERPKVEVKTKQQGQTGWGIYPCSLHRIMCAPSAFMSINI